MNIVAGSSIGPIAINIPDSINLLDNVKKEVLNYGGKLWFFNRKITKPFKIDGSLKEKSNAFPFLCICATRPGEIELDVKVVHPVHGSQVYYSAAHFDAGIQHIGFSNIVIPDYKYVVLCNYRLLSPSLFQRVEIHCAGLQYNADSMGA